VKKRIVIVAAVALCVAGVLAVVNAGEKGPQKHAATLALGAGTITPVPTGDTGSFSPQYVVFQAAVGETQTVKYVTASTSANYPAVTNTFGTKVIAAGDFTLALTNMPPMFAGDQILITSSATAVTNRAYLVGTLWN
jgi:hypothetical protein